MLDPEKGEGNRSPGSGTDAAGTATGGVAPAPAGIGLIAPLLLVTALWGFNFVVIAVGVRDVPPLFLAALRFMLASFPAIFFVRKPKAPARLIIAYGLVLGVGEFGLLFSAIKLGAGAGLSSLVLQSQAFFTAVIAALFLGEPMKPRHVVGMALAFGGLALLALSRYSGSGAAMPLLPLAMILAAALMWAIANALAKKMGKVDALGLMVWSSLASPIPLLGLSFALEGKEAIGAALAGMSVLSLGALAYLAFLSTLVGYGLWNALIARRGAAAIAPYSLLVPIFGLASSALVLGEALDAYSVAAAALVFAGLLVHAFGGRVASALGFPRR